MENTELTNNLEPKEKISKKVLIGGGVVAAVAVVGIVFAATRQTADPKTVVIDALKGVYSSENQNPGEEVFGFSELGKTLEETGGEMGLELSLSGASESDILSLVGAGFTLDAKSDVQGVKFSENMSIQYGGMDLAHIQLYGDDTYLKAAVPELSGRVFSINYADDLAGQLENSPLVLEMGLELTEEDKALVNDYMEYVSGLYSSDNETFDIMALWERYKTGSQAINDFKAAMTVEKKSETQTMIYNGQEAACTGYDVVLPRDSVIQFVRTTADFFLTDETMKQDILEYMTWMMRLSDGMGMSDSELTALVTGQWNDMDQSVDEAIAALDEALQQDVTMTVYVDKKGNLVSLEVSTEFTVSEGEVLYADGRVQLAGGAYPTQNGEMSLDLSDGTDTISLKLNKSGEYTDAVLNSAWDLSLESDGTVMSLNYQSDYDRASGDLSIAMVPSMDGESIIITVDGIVDELEKGKNIHYTVDSIKIEVEGGYYVELAGSAYIKQLEGEITPPEGTEMDVLAATEDEWNEVGEEIIMGFFGILGSAYTLY